MSLDDLMIVMVAIDCKEITFSLILFFVILQLWQI